MSLSACVTRILSLSGFPPSLKTRDIQAAFGEYENERGGFRIKWIDDTSLLIVFNDAAVGELTVQIAAMDDLLLTDGRAAKKAYLQTLVNPPPQFMSPTSDKAVHLRPYDGPDAQNVIAAVNSRASGHRARASISASSGNVMAGLVQVGGSASAVNLPSLPSNSTSTSTANNTAAGVVGSHTRTGSRSGPWKKPLNIDPAAAAVQLSSASPLAREPSPSLPNLPSHPTLGSLISSSLTDISHDGIVTS